MAGEHLDGVQTIAATVLTAGRPRDVTSISVDREIPSTGPASLPAGGGITAATGELTLEDPGTAIEVRRGSPWFRDRGWPPALGDPVQVDVDVDGNTSRRFTGVVEDAAGSTTGPVDVAIVDDVDRLHRLYSAEPIARGEWVADNTGAVNEVDPWLRHEHHVTAAMRACGYWPTAVPNPGASFVAPMTGSILPTIGSVYACAMGQPGQWRPAPFGMGLEGVAVSWKVGEGPRASGWNLLTYTAPHGTAGDSAVFRISTADQLGDLTLVGEVQINYPTPTTVRVRVRWDGVNVGADVTVPYQPGQPLRILRQLPASGLSRIWHGDTEAWSGSAGSGGLPLEDPISELRLTGAGIIVGATYLSWHTDAPTVGPPTARLDMSPILTGTLGATPHIERVDALTFLREVAERTLSDMWIDRDGTLHWAGVGALATRAPDAELTADADLIDLAWEETTGNVRRRVQVTCESPAVTASRLGQVVLWEGTAESLEENGDTVTVWATAPAETDWLGASTPVRVTSGDLSPYGSYMGGTRVPPNEGAAPSWASTTYLTTTAERINSQAFKIEHRAKSLSTGTRIELRAMPQTTRPKLSEASLPVIRGTGRVDWAAMTHDAATMGPAWAADYEHEAGPWVQGADCGRLADWIAGWVTAPGPLLRELPIVYRSDLELGQVVEVIEDAVYHIRVRAVVVGLSESHEAGSSEMTATLRVLALAQQPTTLDTFDQVWAGGTLGIFDSERAGQTLAQLDANPLTRE